jgi:penicillin-binding protein 2
VIAERQTVQPKDIVLTIDADFQKTVYTTLGDVKGSAVILDPRNGAVLALASAPSFDPNWFITGLTGKQLDQVNDATKQPLLDRAAQASYPTGSIFKVITMAAGMADLGYTGDTTFDCPSEWSLPGSDQVYRDWTVEEGLGAQGSMTLHWALVNSCDTVFYQVGAALDKKDESLLPDMAKAFGLGRATGIPYLNEIAGIVPDPQWKQQVVNDYWARGDAVNLSIGQGYLEATPLQMAVAYAAIANKGSVLQPYIVEFTKASDGTLTRVGKKTVTNKLPLSKSIINEIQSALRDQTSNAAGAGSYKVFGDMTWPIAGKTGTAENALDVSKKPHSWFAAFGPYGDTATIASIVMVESSGEGVSFAAPRTRAIYEAYLKTNLANETDKKS